MNITFDPDINDIKMLYNIGADRTAREAAAARIVGDHHASAFVDYINRSYGH